MQGRRLFARGKRLCARFGVRDCVRFVCAKPLANFTANDLTHFAKGFLLFARLLALCVRQRRAHTPAQRKPIVPGTRATFNGC